MNSRIIIKLIDLMIRYMRYDPQRDPYKVKNQIIRELQEIKNDDSL